MESDMELLKLAAKAAGMTLEPSIYPGWFMCDGRQWNPLIDDGDALRLAVRLGIQISFSVDMTRVFAKRWDIPDMDEYAEDNSGDLLTAARRAIVRAAAEIGKVMP